jgi:hypothetical protein
MFILLRSAISIKSLIFGKEFRQEFISGWPGSLPKEDLKESTIKPANLFSLTLFIKVAPSDL